MSREIYAAIPIVAVLMIAIGAALHFARDDSDASGVIPSGMRVHTDALTGCQYLSTYRGGIVPRLRGDGKQVGCRP